MASYNKVLLMGNLTRDPQLRYTPSQMAVADFGIAVNEKFTTKSGEKREDVAFIDITAWGKQAELINQYFTKGKPIFIEGRLKYETWDDKQGGGKRHKLTVTLDGFQFVGGRDGGGGGGGGGGSYDQGAGPGDFEDSAPPQRSQSRPAPNRPPQRPAPRQAAPAEQPYGDEQQFKDDDIPF
ncbi:MAG TPA: single-stranded DNA-binding protein [Tepidisphaeraceae bacterium]|jgi:single-strand DNA-binding protein|nr:single-stranded DNA-binding protein [Tepidisphaeraceae bacterium]